VREAVFTGQGDIEKTMIEQLNNCLVPALPKCAKEGEL